jgi:hypothetical protein
MNVTITEFCEEVKNWFDCERAFGIFEIKNGTIVIPDMQNGQYFRICDSVFNDGVYQYPASGLKDEVFDGAIWYMAVPPDAISLVADMTAWETKNADAINSPYQSESFGGYSYSLKSSGAGGNVDGSVDAFSHFSSKLNRYRKVRKM